MNLDMGIQDKITGRVKQAAGSLAGDEELRAQGLREERKGQAKEELDNANAEADAKADEVARLERKSAKARSARTAPRRP
jgi:uncharacterized protein YjbJ (UPF0337 family)